ncbi:flavin reductase family protein [Psychrobacter aquaticus]|uniref:Flavodoxin reductases (Ferredoxin-NADPH reductases) family 1 n=1 Tax=Psychrobacter aquaticus CMS 56 TaxID=1354303 RepID=U4TAC8_9GAMM|nr:iron-sulfur cluster-binding domain-containing protein [Psychrobacter aquaticus]ERL55664.1 Flavodoxin reductases (ferredoxin-NADPH reductases) family 1 [Psychrobacter aquaticus CMS 56]
MANGYRPEVIQRAFVDFVGSRLHPFWSLTAPKLRLLARYTLSEDLIALQFETNQAFRQQVSDWQGGQYVNISVLIDGIYHQRSYSLVGLAHQPLWWHDDIDTKARKNRSNLTVTIAIKPQGLVSDYLTKRMPIGTILNSSVPSGSFTLAQALLAKQSTSIDKHAAADMLKQSAPLLFIAGGSGITPMLGLITQALQSGHQVTLLHYNRTPLLDNQWQQLAAMYPAFTYHLINTEDANSYLAGTRHISTDSLLALDLPLADTQIFACGSHALLAGLHTATNKITLPNGKKLRDHVTVENFGNILPDFYGEQTHDKAEKPGKQTVYLRARQQQFSSDTTLLVAAEKAGIRLTHGCRQGICQLCRCHKISGVVKNIQTGKMSSDGDEFIQTCINVAMTDIVLDV